MKLVKEQLNEAFKNDNDPISKLDIGENSEYYINKKIENFKRLGIKFPFLKELPSSTQIKQFEKIINALIKVDVKYEDIQIRKNNVRVSCYNIYDDNRVIHQCITEEDANHLLKAIKSFIPYNEYRYSIPSSSLDKIDISIDDLKFLEELKHKRKLYSRIYD